MTKFLPVVHTVDTEGPLNEPVKIIFKRIYALFGLKFKPTKKNLKKILDQRMYLPLVSSKKKNFIKYLINDH